MSWSFEWSMVADALTNLIHRIGEAIDVIIGTLKITFP